MKVNGILATILLVVIVVSLLQSEPGFNSGPGCGGSGCHTLQSGNVTATVLSGNQVQITVTGTTSRVGGELVNSSGVVVAVINSTTSNPFILTAPSGGTYTVNAGYKSPSRNWGTTSVNIAAAPIAPSVLNSTPISNSQINISWTDNSNNEDGFKIERKTTVNGTYAEIAQVGPNVTTYNNNSGLSGGTQYCYRVRSYNAAGNSAYTTESCNTTFPNAPSAPLNLVASVLPSPLSVQLTWTDNSTNEDGFIIEKETLTDAFVVIDTVSANITGYQDLDVTNQTYNYRIQAFNVTGVSGYSAIAQVSVPVELTSFTANVVASKVNLIWKTATETNNSGFNVERAVISTEGRNPFWENQGFVNGHGTTTEPHSYSFDDENITTGKYLYRLKQIDFNGMYEYSSEIEVVVNAPDKYSLNQNYPNPFNPSTAIEFQLPRESFVTLKIYNILGVEIATLVNELKHAGVHKINFNASGLTSGLYIYKISTGSFEQTRKMMLLK